MTAHELAKKLLEGPDVEVVLFQAKYGLDSVAEVWIREDVSYTNVNGIKQRGKAIQFLI